MLIVLGTSAFGGKLFVILSLLVILFSRTYISAEDFKFNKVSVVDASDVKGVKSVLAKYDFASDELTVGKRPWGMSDDAWKHVLLHELVHRSGHESRLSRVKLGKKVDWFLEEVIAEKSAHLLNDRDKWNERVYLASHPLYRVLTSDEEELVSIRVKEAVSWVEKHLKDLDALIDN